MSFRHNIPAIAWALVILVLSLTPGSRLPRLGLLGIPHPDKFAHAFIYAVLTILLVAGLARQPQQVRLRSHPMAWAFGLASVYGTLIEVLQGAFVEGRTFEWLDIAANMAGAALGLLAMLWLQSRRQPAHEGHPSS